MRPCCAAVAAALRAALRDKREARGLSQAALASALGLARTSISNIERGDQAISLQHLYVAAAVLGTTVHELLPESVPTGRHSGRRSAEVAKLLSKLGSTPGGNS